MALSESCSIPSGGVVNAGRYAASVSALFADGVASVVSLAADFPPIGGHAVSLSVLSGSLPAGVTLDPVGKRLIYDGTPGVTTVSATLQAKANAPKLSFSNASGTVPVSAAVVFPRGVVTGPLGTSELGLRAVVRRTWNDGSAKHVLVCGTVNAANTVTFNTAPQTGSALTSANIQAAAPTAVVDLGVLGSVSLASLLASPFETWVSTPAMVECHYRGAFAGTDVVAEFHVRLFSNGEMWVRACVENSNRLLSAAVHQTLTGTVSIFGTTVQTYSATPLYCNTQHIFERWSGTQHDVVVNHDVRQIVATKMVPNFGMTSSITEGRLNTLPTTYTPNSNLLIEAAMGSTGYQAGIGVLPLWDAAYLVSGDSRAWRSVMAHGKAAHSYRILWRKDGRMLIPTDYPTSNAEGVGGGGNNSVGAGGLTFELAHHPSMGYLAYLLTGDALYADAMTGVAAAFFQITSCNRGDGTARIVRDSQTRTTGWFQRSLGHVAGILPDSAPELAALKTWLTSQVNYYASLTIDDPAAVNSQLGYPGSIGTYNEAAGITVAPWMFNFWIGSIGHISDLDALSGADLTKMQALRDWMYRGITGLLGDGSQYCFTYAGWYSITVSSEVVPNYTVRPASALYQTWGEVMTASHGAQTCGTALLGGGGGGPTVASTGYWGNLMPAIAFAVEHNASGATAAYARLTGASNWATEVVPSGFDTAPQWGVTPRPTPAPVNKALSLSITGASEPAWRAGIAVNTWGYVGNTLETINPENNPAMNPNYPGNAPWHGTGGFPTIITGWSGGCIDASDRYHIWGEGHADGASNAKPYLDLSQDDPTWVLPRAPTGAIGNTGTLDDGNLASGVYFDGRPRGQHTYNQIIALGDKVWVMPGGSQFQGGGATRHIHCYDQAIQDWEPSQLAHESVYSIPFYGGGCDYDATRNLIWTGGYNNWSQFNPTTRVWTGRGGLPNGWSGGYYSVKYNAAHDLCVLFPSTFGSIQLYDPDTSTWSQATTSGTFPAFDLGTCGIVWDAPRNRYLLWDTGANFVTLTPPASNPKVNSWVWGTLNAAAGNAITPTKAAAGTYGRLVITSDHKFVVCVNSTTSRPVAFALE